VDKAQPARFWHGSYFNFKERLPSLAQVLPVYAVIMVIVYTWTLLWFFWKVPSWLFFMNAGDLLAVIPYLFATNFAESLVVLCGPLLLSLVLPKTWFHDVFVARGAGLSIAALGYMMYLANQFKNKSDYPTLSLQLWSVLLAFAGIAVLGYLFGRFKILRRIMELISDRATIFVYILVPLSVLSLLVIIVRALLG
jgi:hypothetical protein